MMQLVYVIYYELLPLMMVNDLLLQQQKVIYIFKFFFVLYLPFPKIVEISEPNVEHETKIGTITAKLLKNLSPIV